jgi:hypothetical protein
LFVRQTFHRGGQHLLVFVRGRELGLEVRLALECGGRFPAGPALCAAQTIERGRADSRVKESSVLERILAPPKTDKRFLHDILGFRPAIRPAARKQKQSGAELSETGLPIVFALRVLHFVFTIFYD